MDDPFYNPASHEAAHSGLWQTILSAPPALLITIFLAPLLLVVVTRLWSGRTSDGELGDEEMSGTQSYWFPSIGREVLMLVFHGFNRARRDTDGVLDYGMPMVVQGMWNVNRSATKESLILR